MGEITNFRNVFLDGEQHDCIEFVLWLIDAAIMPFFGMSMNKRIKCLRCNNIEERIDDDNILWLDMPVPNVQMGIDACLRYEYERCDEHC